jgi:hypothetical protein
VRWSAECLLMVDLDVRSTGLLQALMGHLLLYCTAYVEGPSVYYDEEGEVYEATSPPEVVGSPVHKHIVFCVQLLLVHACRRC